jgi:hypothetical protein
VLALTQSKNTELVDAGSLYKEVRAILDEVRGRASRLVNVEMVRPTGSWGRPSSIASSGAGTGLVTTSS